MRHCAVALLSIVMLMQSQGTAYSQTESGRNAYSTTIQILDNTIYLKGLAPSPLERYRLRELVKQRMPQAKIVDNLEIRGGAIADWRSISRSALEALASLGNGRATLYHDYLVLEGKAASNQLAKQVAQKITRLSSKDFQAYANVTSTDVTNLPVNQIGKFAARSSTTSGTAATNPQIAMRAPEPNPGQPAAGTGADGFGIITFETPVPFGAFPVQGNSLSKLVKGQPFFPPIKGLPENLWKKSCDTCHKWNKARLCSQGKSYMKAAKFAFRHQHPYGGSYKVALMKWAESGCQ